MHRVEFGVGTYVGGAGLHQCAQCLSRTLEDVVAGQCRFKFSGNRYGLFQCAGAIGLAVHDIGFFQVQVPFDKPRDQHVAVAFDFLRGVH